MSGLGLPDSTLSILKESKSCGTWRQYESSWKKWSLFCNENRWSEWEPNVRHCLLFLTDLYEKGLSYSAINSSRSALSSLLGNVEGAGMGQHKLVVEFMKGVARLRPPSQRYSFVWNPDTVLSYLVTYDINNCSSVQLTLKTVALLALATGQRVQTLVSIKLDDIIWGNPVQIRLTGILKTTSVNNSNPILVLPYFTENTHICPALALRKYVDDTKNLRLSSQLFIATTKPFKPICSQTISRWLVNVLKLSGVDISKYSAHSFRHSATSKASQLGVNVDTILKRIGWSAKSKVFAKFYKRPIEQASEFAEKVLSMPD